ncbi:MAG: SipW-dependent-type signal peptide-containing protein [Bacilli bacterium]|nr:SipW-dependent-type signal peptide-containing protein [Bacilli bacterium]
MEIKNKKSLIYVVLVFIVFLVLGTIAYFTSTDTLENIFLSVLIKQ